MFKRTILAATITLASTAHAQSDVKLDEILQYMKSMDTKLEAMRSDIEVLQSYHAAPRSSAEAPANAPVTTVEAKTDSITREGGVFASIHPADRDGKLQPPIGRMIVGGFPMKHNVGLERFKLNKDQWLGYLGKGELNISEEGLHSFSINTTGTTSFCSFKLDIQGQPVLNVSKINRATFTAELELQKGWYSFTTYQFCYDNTAVWHLNMLTPSALNPVPLTTEYLFHRK